MDQRASGLPKLYKDKAHAIDTKYCHTAAQHVGPLQQRLESFGKLICLVAGQYGEISQDFHSLLKDLAAFKGTYISHSEGRPVSEAERGLLLHQLRRGVSVSIITVQSSCLLSRLGHMAPGAREAAKRRAFAKQREEAAIKDRRAHFEALVCGQRLRNIGVLTL